MDRATEGLPSSVQDWSYCCEPSSTRATSRRRTMPLEGKVVLLRSPELLAEFCDPWVSWLLWPPWPEEDEELPLEDDCVSPFPGAALRMMLANSSGLLRRPRVLMASWNCWPGGAGS